MRNPLKIVLLCAMWFIGLQAHSQCQSVCINGGTVATVSAGTQTVVQQPGTTFTLSAKGSYTATSNYSLVTTAGTQTIVAGALSVSFSNVGSTGALFNGVTFPAGATINISLPNSTLPQYTFNCLTSSLMVLVNR